MEYRCGGWVGIKVEESKVDGGDVDKEHVVAVRGVVRLGAACATPCVAVVSVLPLFSWAFSGATQFTVAPGNSKNNCSGAGQAKWTPERHAIGSHV
jgi:hypothetical protein